MSARIAYETFVRDAAPVASALSAMSKAVDASGLEKPLTELLKIRASQINGCAFCI
ncbi:MAG: carboxymuconolactone decarboxylase family protein, partial [Paraburkholderia sp.]|nr:carboxymuconolactone decarboxylase family protein [Paraburkholderia sp.]